MVEAFSRQEIEEKLINLRKQLDLSVATSNALQGAIQFAESLLAEKKEKEKPDAAE